MQTAMTISTKLQKNQWMVGQEILNRLPGTLNLKVDVYLLEKQTKKG